MTPNLKLFLRAGLALMAAGAGACTTPAEPPTSVRILTWWSARGERDAMDKLRHQFDEQHPQQPIDDSPLDVSMDARASLVVKMRDLNPPDAFLANGGWDLFRWVFYNGRNDSQNKLVALDTLVTAERWRNVMPPAVLDTVTITTDVSTHIYAVPLGIHRLNTLFFNKAVFADAGVPEPNESTTVDGLFALLAQLEAAGVTAPLALSTKVRPWLLPILLFENLLMARAGPTYYRSYFCGHEDPMGPPIAAALQDLGRLLGRPHSNTDRLQLGWDQSLNLVRDRRAALAIMGDWARGYFLATAPDPDQIGEVVFPGTSDVFVFTTDTFALPVGAHNSAGAQELLRFIGSQEAQDIFNPVKGSTSPRRDSNEASYLGAAKDTRTAFWAIADNEPGRLVPATSMLARQEFMDKISDVLGDFADSTDGEIVNNASRVLYTFKNYYDILQENSSPTLCP
jgi:glucose/mannose transport system substrate-binding protein